MDPWRAPERIVSRHVANQYPHILGDRWSTEVSPTSPGPEPPEPLPVPGDDRLRLDDDECRSPAAPHVRQPCPQPAVRFRQANPWRPRPLEHEQLMPQRQDLEMERCS